ncbi:VTT domain-containing protein [Candidatus Daviesbacteria bacterium]|nr:VTT domain-containing protein [Candidatus Daviesbacteria bacterium]
MHFDLVSLIKTFGLLGVFIIVFVESGLLIGFFFPGDSLLFTAGFLASQDVFNIYILAIGCFIAAVTGDSIGYYIGHKWGRKLFHKEDSIFFHKDHLLKAQAFYEKHGGKTIILARFMPIIRTFAPVVAGIGSMRYPNFLFYNLVGGFLWAVCVTLAGYFLGQVIPAEVADKYIIIITLAIILLSISPGLYHALKNKESRAKTFKLCSLLFRKLYP